MKKYYTPETLAGCFFPDLMERFRYSASSVQDIYVTGIVNQNDQRSRTTEMERAKKREMGNLLDTVAFENTQREDVPKRSKYLTREFRPSF